MIIGPMFSGKVLVEKLNEVMRLSKTSFDDLLVSLYFFELQASLLLEVVVILSYVAFLSKLRISNFIYQNWYCESLQKDKTYLEDHFFEIDYFSI